MHVTLSELTVTFVQESDNPRFNIEIRLILRSELRTNELTGTSRVVLSKSADLKASEVNFTSRGTPRFKII